MKHFLLVLFTVYLCSKFSFQQTPLLENLTPQGHVLDCANRCEVCADEEKDFNPTFRSYTDSINSKKKPFVKDDLMKLIYDKLNKKAKRRQASLQDPMEESDEEKLNAEVAKSEELLDQEVKVAVEKVTSIEGNMNSDKINDIGSRVREKLREKYRKEAAKRLGIDLEKLHEHEQHKDDADETHIGRMNLRKSNNEVSLGSTSRSKAKFRTLEDLYKKYFKVCVVSANIFYS